MIKLERIFLIYFMIYKKYNDSFIDKLNDLINNKKNRFYY